MPAFRSSILVLCAAIAACSPDFNAPEEQTPRPAKLLTLGNAQLQQASSLPAVVRSVRTTDLAFQVGGQILEWNVYDGAELGKGDVIARLDARSFNAAVEQAEAQYQNAESEYQRAVRLIEEDAISLSVVEGRDAQRQIAKASLDTARKNLSDTVLRAPFRGFVGNTNVEQFQNVAPQQPVLVLQSQAVEAVVNVPARFVLNSNRVRYFNTFVELDAAPDRRFAAVFRDATGQADSSTQTFEAHFSFTPPADLVVLTGMTATLYFEAEEVDSGEEQRGVAMPLAAVMADGDDRYVWAVTGPDKTIERRDVTLLDSVGETLIATSGVKAGETIVAAGGAYLQEGDPVRPWQDQ